MMKFFTKKILSIVSIALAVIVVGVTWASVMLSSKSTYDEYYKQAIAEKEHKKYLNSLPLELKGISAELAEGKEYFTDGLASPKNEDLVVTAHFTEKGKDFDKYLRSDAYDMTVAEDFAEKGGKLCSVILMSQTYREYIDGYLTCENDFDSLSFRQLYSKKSDDGVTEVAYSADMTIALAAKYSSLGFSVGDRIVATYEIYGDHITDEVTYSLTKPDGTEKLFLRREFSYSEKLPGLTLPSPDTATVTVIFNHGTENETKSVFSAQKGCYLGISRGNIKSTFYTDAALSSVFTPEDTLIEGDITLYAAGN